MRCGICTWILGTMDLEEMAAHAARIGFDGIELLADVDRYTASDVMRIVGNHGLEILSMTPADADPAHPDAAIRDRAIDRYFRMLDLAAGVGAPTLGFHGAVGRVRPLSDPQEEECLLLDSAQRVASRAEDLGIDLAIELLNRYESHLLNRVEQGIRFAELIGSSHVGLLLDTYHMNLEEADPGDAVLQAGSWLRLLHLADSNRRGIGRGHIRFGDVFDGLTSLGYDGPLVVEAVVPDADPFSPPKGSDSALRTMDEAEVSLAWLRTRMEKGDRQGH